jgi:wyosine [tRNA(Phe)-imidazoG37] synthetase (radical SAM superfamily)
MGFRHVYGPVPSRRLGRSLGVNPIPFKTCNHSCVYCQLGRTFHRTNERWDFFFREDIVREIRHSVTVLAARADCVTFMGEGEPTLCRSLGYLIQRTKDSVDLPVAVITNGSLLSRSDVRRELLKADLVLPSLDAADQKTYQRINRPHARLEINEIIEGLVRFRESFPGKLWIEVMLVRGINDAEAVLSGLREALQQIRPDRIHVNVPFRAPAERWVRPPDSKGLALARSLLTDAVFIDSPESGPFTTAGFDSPLDAILMIVRRHPMRKQQIAETLPDLSGAEVAAALRQLKKERRVQAITYGKETYYIVADGIYASEEACVR